MGLSAIQCPDCGEWFYSYYGGVVATTRWAEHYALKHTGSRVLA